MSSAHTRIRYLCIILKSIRGPAALGSHLNTSIELFTQFLFNLCGTRSSGNNLWINLARVVQLQTPIAVFATTRRNDTIRRFWNKFTVFYAA